MPEYLDIAIKNPDFFTTIIVLGIIIVVFVPILWYMIKQNNNNMKDLVKSNIKGFEQLSKDFKESIDNHSAESREGLRTILASVGKVKIETSKLQEIASRYVLSASFSKLDYIKDRLEKNEIKKREKQIKRQIKAELNRISDNEYIKPLNSFATPVGPLGDWIKKHFSDEEFFEELFDVIFRNEDKLDIPKKITDITTIMKSYQNELWDKLYNELK